VDELAEASAIRNDPDALRRRLADDGYLFFRGLAACPPGPSRYFAVHPGWQHWQRPDRPVH